MVTPVLVLEMSATNNSSWQWKALRKANQKLRSLFPRSSEGKYARTCAGLTIKTLTKKVTCKFVDKDLRSGDQNVSVSRQLAPE